VDDRLGVPSGIDPVRSVTYVGAGAVWPPSHRSPGGVFSPDRPSTPVAWTRLVPLLLAVGLLNGCSQAAVPASPELSPSSAFESTPASAPSTTPGTTPTATPNPRPSSLAPSESVAPMLLSESEAMVPVEAAARLLASAGATVRWESERWKDTEESEILMIAEGRVDPAGGRGDLMYDFTTFFNFTGVPVILPDPDHLYQVRWDASETYFFSLSTADEGWGHMSRADARERAGILGYLYTEVLGIVELVAHTEPASVTGTTAAAFEGANADRYVATIDVTDAIAEGVPAGVADADVFRGLYQVDTIEIEVWLVHGELLRIRYSLSREKALYGGPDRTQITYDFASGPPADIEIPPPGPIVER
jgi:hypothetical protein